MKLKKAKSDWYKKVLLAAIASLEKRHPTRRGPFVIADSSLRRARLALSGKEESDA